MTALPYIPPAVEEFSDLRADVKRNLLNALLNQADWILTGRSTRPEQLSQALLHYADRKYDRLKLDPVEVAVLASLLADIAVGIPPTLQCWKCGAGPKDCGCCPKHRLDDQRAEDCARCAEVQQ